MNDSKDDFHKKRIAAIKSNLIATLRGFDERSEVRATFRETKPASESWICTAMVRIRKNKPFRAFEFMFEANKIGCTAREVTLYR